MGLDTTHDAWHGAYSRFHRFRIHVAQAIGIDLTKMKGFRRDDVHGTPFPDPQEKPLVYLLDHSDCEGFISPRHCEPLARRLREIAPSLTEEDFGQRAIQFAEGCEEACRAEEPLEFM